jgi:hypothetical protein
MRATRNVLAGVILVLALAAFAAAAYAAALFIWSTWGEASTQAGSLRACKILITLVAALFPFLCLAILASISEWIRRE